jgi:phosphoribosylglycinamide formyltransferase 1
MERTTPQIYRIIVITGGHSRGSNLRALDAFFREMKLPVKIVAVVNNHRHTPVWEFCAKQGINCVFISTRNMQSFEDNLLKLCDHKQPHAIVLAGFLKLLSERLISAVPCDILNIHPALIPKYCGAGMYGMKVHEAVLASGEKVSGATVHLVDPVYDHGRILKQEIVDVSDCDKAVEIATRVLAVEHSIYGATLWEYLRERYP